MQAYVEMRNAGADARSNDRRITATTRQLESMIRLSEAHARMRYSEQVEVEDVEEANRLIREALKESAVRSHPIVFEKKKEEEEELTLFSVFFHVHKKDGPSHWIDRPRFARGTIDAPAQVEV